MAFSDDDVSDASNIGNSESNKTGVYFFNGDKSSLASAKGTLSSGYFRVDGTSFFSYKIGAAKDQSKIFIQFFEEGSDTPLSFKANGGDEALTQIGNVDLMKLHAMILLLLITSIYPITLERMLKLS